MICDRPSAVGGKFLEDAFLYMARHLDLHQLGFSFDFPLQGDVTNIRKPSIMDVLDEYAGDRFNRDVFNGLEDIFFHRSRLWDALCNIKGLHSFEELRLPRLLDRMLSHQFERKLDPDAPEYSTQKDLIRSLRQDVDAIRKGIEDARKLLVQPVEGESKVEETQKMLTSEDA